MPFEDYYIVGVIVALIGGFVFFIFGILPKLAEKQIVRFGGLERNEMISKMKSDNKLYTTLRTGSLYIVAGGLAIILVLMFFIVSLTDATIPRVMIWGVGTAGGVTIFFSLSFAVQIHNWGRKFTPVSHIIAPDPDGLRVIEKDIIIEKYNAVGEFDKEERAKYLSLWNLQFCEHFRKELAKPLIKEEFLNQDGEVNIAKLEPHHFNWMRTDDAGEQIPTDWDSFCANHCLNNGGETCQFYHLRKKLLTLDSWRIYYAHIKQFGLFPMAIYIMDDTFTETIPRFEKEFKIRGVYIHCSAGHINVDLVAITHTIYCGVDGSQDPQKILAPVFWVTDSASHRKRRFNMITPELMRQDSMENILSSRPEPNVLKAVDSVLDMKTKYRRLAKTIVAGKNQAYEWATNIFRAMKQAGRELNRFSKIPYWFWVVLITGLAIVALVVVWKYAGGSGVDTFNETRSSLL